MTPRLLLLLILSLFSSCQFIEVMNEEKRQVFADDLADLKAYFQIPGMAVMVLDGREVIYEDYLGKADIEEDMPVTEVTLWPIASITKVYSAVLIHQLANSGSLSLDKPVNKFLEDSVLSDSVRIKHLLSHTSEGQIGEQFHYSGRFALLTRVIEKATGRPFRQVMDSAILSPMGMRHSFLFANAEEARPYRHMLARGYSFEGTLSACRPDYGYSASAGLFTTTRDLSRLAIALRYDSLLNEHSKKIMRTPPAEGLPYGHGIFVQELNGKKVLWAYGQYDCYSSLLVMVPDEDMSMILMANNNLTSDPARLINGDISSSLFATSFLKNFIFGKSEMPILETQASLETLNPKGYHYRRKLVAQIMAESYMSRFDTSRYHTSQTLLQTLFTHYPTTKEYASPNLMHAIMFLKDVAGHYDLSGANRFDVELGKMGSYLLEQEPYNPYLHIYMGYYYDEQGDTEEAREHFSWLVNVENFSDNWYKKDAQAWLNQHPLEQ